MNEREKEILSLIIEDFIETAEPVSSINLLKSHQIKWSGATIRSVMSTLEKKGYLKKSHIQSGRIPTSKGYKVYTKALNNIVITDAYTKKITKKLELLFEKRDKNISDVIEKTTSLISEFTNLAMVAKTSNDEEIIKAINLFVIDEKKSVITIVVNDEDIKSSVVNLPKELTSRDITIATEIFNNRLKGLKLKEVQSTLISIKPLIEKKIKNAEQLFKIFIGEVFSNLISEKKYTSGISNIVNYKNNYANLNIEKLLKIIEDNSIWNIIKDNDDHVQEQVSKSEIQFINKEKENLENLVLIDKHFYLNGENTQLTIAAPTRVKYKEIFAILKWLDKKISEINKEKNQKRKEVISE